MTDALIGFDYYNTLPGNQPDFPHAVVIGGWKYPTDEQGRALETCPLCDATLPPLGATPGHKCNTPWVSQQEYLKTRHLALDE